MDNQEEQCSETLKTLSTVELFTLIDRIELMLDTNTLTPSNSSRYMNTLELAKDTLQERNALLQ